VHRLATWFRAVLIPSLGPFGYFFAAFLDSSFLSLFEINDLLMVRAGAKHPGTAWMAVIMTTLGSLAGCSVVWWLGRRGGEALLEKRLGPLRSQKARAAFERWDLLVLAVPAVLPPPVPFKVFVLAAGVFAFPYRRFAITLLVARGLRYGAWALLGVVYGRSAGKALRGFEAWFWSHLPAVLSVLGMAALAAFGVACLVRGRGGRAGAPGSG
jgi:membrane protein YqaA with SNARE-associated domain